MSDDPTPRPRWRGYVVPSALVLAALVVWWYLPATRAARRMLSYQPSHAADDARQDWQAGDRHFLGVLGIGILVPGVSETQAGLLPKVALPDTSDVIRDRNHAEWQGIAAAYAEAYNAEVLILLKAQQPPSATGPSVR